MAGILGVDIGNVICEGNYHSGREDTPLDDRGAREVQGAIDAITRLTLGRFHHNVYLVSKAGVRMRQKSIDWLRSQAFFTRTGIPESHVHFCFRREEKREICAKLGITHFVDDRLEVLSHLVGVVPTLILFRERDGDRLRWPEAYKKVNCVENWDDAEYLLNRLGKED